MPGPHGHHSLAEKYCSVSLYAFCAGNPVNFVDPQGDSLKIVNNELLSAINNGLEENIDFVLNNGVIDPISIPKSSDWFIKDLAEIVNSEQMVELSVANSYQHQDEYGNVSTETFNTIEEYNTNDYCGKSSPKLDGVKEGRLFNGNTGRILVPKKSNSMSMNGNIQIIINAKDALNHRTVGIAHEFGHAILYLRGLPHKHGDPGADDFIKRKATLMSKRLGYDF